MQTHGMHGMHRLLGNAAIMTVGLVLASGVALAAEAVTIPTAEFAAPRCMVGEPCTFAAPVFACNYADAEKIAAAGPVQGNAIGMGLVRGQTCQAVPAGRPVKTEATALAQVVYLTEAGQHLGYMPVGVFASVEAAVVAEPERQIPVRVTTRVRDLVLYRRGPAPVAAQISGQGTAKAVGLFRSGAAERRDYCSTSVGDSRAAMQRCLKTYQDDESFPAHADCENRVVTVLDQTYRLHQRPAKFPADGNVDEKRKWLWQDVANDEWLDGTTPSHEPQADSAFDALCPGRRPDADHGLVLRDPAAQFPPPLRGTWAPNSQTCDKVIRAQDPKAVEGALIITAGEVQGIEYHEALNQIRRTDQGWVADVIWESDGDTGLASVRYEPTGDSLLIVGTVGSSKLVRCSR